MHETTAKAAPGYRLLTHVGGHAVERHICVCVCVCVCVCAR